MNSTHELSLTPSEILEKRQNSLKVRVRSITFQGEDINAYEVIPVDRDLLPEFTPGAHIDIYFRDGRVRQYSLCSDPQDLTRYVFAVQRDVKGRGGSKALFEKVHVGRTLVISTPRNAFPLSDSAERHLFLAGGIGITPIVSMVTALERQGADFKLHYCTRSSDRTAFRDELKAHIGEDRFNLHHDEGDPSKGLDLLALLKEWTPGTHLYLCGPPGFLKAAKEASSHWPEGTVHFESFTPPLVAQRQVTDECSPDGAIPVGFEIEVSSSGERWAVPPDKTILEVLREHGHQVPSSCEAGVCGTCKVGYLEGEPDHQDYILSDSDKREMLLVCCSRSKSPRLVLDL